MRKVARDYRDYHHPTRDRRPRRGITNQRRKGNPQSLEVIRLSDQIADLKQRNASTLKGLIQSNSFADVRQPTTSFVVGTDLYFSSHIVTFLTRVTPSLSRFGPHLAMNIPSPSWQVTCLLVRRGREAGRPSEYGRKGNIKANELSENRTTDLASLTSTASTAIRARARQQSVPGLSRSKVLTVTGTISKGRVSSTGRGDTRNLLEGLCTQANPEQIVRPSGMAGGRRLAPRLRSLAGYRPYQAGQPVRRSVGRLAFDTNEKVR